MGFIFLGIIRSENFDRFRKLCFNHFGKVMIYLIKFKTIFEEINPSISGKIIHKNNKITSPTLSSNGRGTLYIIMNKIKGRERIRNTVIKW